MKGTGLGDGQRVPALGVGPVILRVFFTHEKGLLATKEVNMGVSNEVAKGT